MPEVVAAPAAPSAASSSAAPSKPSAAPVKPNPVITSKGQPPAQAGGTQAPPKPEGTAPPPAPSRLTRKEKIDGKEVELSASEDELWAAYRKGSTLDRRFEDVAREKREIAAERQRVQQMEEQIAGDPTGEKMLELYMSKHPDADPIEVLTAILQKRMDEEEKLQDPNIRERRRMERELQGFKDREAEQKTQAEQAEQQRQTQEALNDLGGKFTEALQQTKLPKNDITTALMAQAYRTNKQQGWNLSPAQLAQATEKSFVAMVAGLTGGEDVTDEQVLDMFPDLTKRIHRGIVARYKAKNAAPRQPDDRTPRERRPSAEEPNKQRVVNSAEEAKAYGLKGLRTI